MFSMVGPGVVRLGPLRATCPTEVVTVSIYVIPMASSFMMWLVHIMATVGSITVPAVRVPWVPHEQLLAMGPSTNRPLLLRSPEVVSLAVWFPVAQLAMWALTLYFEPATVPPPIGAGPSFPWNSCYEVSIWTLGGLEGPAQQQ